MTAPSFEARLATLDLSLFAHIHSQSSDDDKRSWLSLQRAIRATHSSYAYLEIGSYLGGSIQPYLLDDRCTIIYSIDKRPSVSRDARGPEVVYRDNSTARMLQLLGELSSRSLDKVIAFETDAAEIDPGLIRCRPRLCFIDGEHTTEAVLRDFEWCLRVCAQPGVIYLHDAGLIYPALPKIARLLKAKGVQASPHKLGGSTFAIALGDDLPADPFLVAIASSGRRFVAFQRLRDQVKRATPARLHRTIGRTLRLLGRPAPPRASD